VGDRGWGLGRTIHENEKAGQDREYLCFADGHDDKRYIVHLGADIKDAVATVEGMPGNIKMLAEVESTRFEGFPSFEIDGEQFPEDWLQGFLTEANLAASPSDRN
jgi:hypothetical protein